MNMTRRQFALAASSFMAGCRALEPEAGTADAAVARWRADFPALRPSMDGGRLAYLDSAATSHRPYAVIHAMSDERMR
jgi:selenocysteine lyase/cysteine desulfurase